MEQRKKESSVKFTDKLPPTRRTTRGCEWSRLQPLTDLLSHALHRGPNTTEDSFSEDTFRCRQDAKGNLWGTHTYTANAAPARPECESAQANFCRFFIDFLAIEYYWHSRHCKRCPPQAFNSSSAGNAAVFETSVLRRVDSIKASFVVSHHKDLFWPKRKPSISTSIPDEPQRGTTSGYSYSLNDPPSRQKGPEGYYFHAEASRALATSHTDYWYAIQSLTLTHTRISSGPVCDGPALFHLSLVLQSRILSI